METCASTPRTVNQDSSAIDPGIYPHIFKRDRSSPFCYVCQNLWPANDGVLSKFYLCSVCGLSVHTGCRMMASNSYICKPGMIHTKWSPSESEKINIAGKIAIEILHGYDIPVPAATAMYGLFRMSPGGEESVRSHIAMSDEKGCVWSSSAFVGPTTAATSEVLYLWHHPSHIHKHPPLQSTSSFPHIEFELWKSMLRLFDGLIASTRISLLPLLLFPNVVVERWFSIQDAERAPSGMILLRLVFIPMVASIRPSATNSSALGQSSPVPEKPSQDTANITQSSAVSLSQLQKRPLSPRSTTTPSPTTSTSSMNILEESQLRSSANKISGTSSSRAGPIAPQVPPLDLRQAGIVGGDRFDDIFHYTGDDPQPTPKNVSTRPPNNGSASSLAKVSLIRNRSVSAETALKAGYEPREYIRAPVLSPLTTRSDHAFGTTNNFPNQTLYSPLMTERTQDSSLTDIDAVPMEPVPQSDRNNIRSPICQSGLSSFPSNSDSESLANNMGLSRRNRLAKSSSLDDRRTKAKDVPEPHSDLKNDDGLVNRPPKLTSSDSASMIPAAKVDSSGWVSWSQGAMGSAYSLYLQSIRGRHYAGSRKVWEDGDPNQVKHTEGEGVGRIHVHLVSAHKAQAKDAAEGDHYVILQIENSKIADNTSVEQVVSTHIVNSSATPFFNRKWLFTAPHYRSHIRLTLVDAQSDRKIGTASVSVYGLMQRDADRYGCDWKKAGAENFIMRDLAEKDVLGYFTAKILFEEDVPGLFTSPHPRLAPTPPQEQLSVERLRYHVSRAHAVIVLFSDCFSEYKYIMAWENPPLTILLLVIFLHATLRINAEYFLCCPLFVVTVLMTRALYRRKSGAFRKKWVEKDEDISAPFRPLAYLRIAITGFRNFSGRSSLSASSIASAQKNLPPLPPYVKISYSTSEGVPKNSKEPSRDLLITCINTSSIDSGSGAGSLTGGLPLSKLLMRSENHKDALLQNITDPWKRPDSNNEDISYLYPILQPLGSSDTETAPSTNSSKGKKEQRKDPNRLLSWNECDNSVKFTLYEDNPLSSFMDSAYGFVKISIKDLVGPMAEKAGGLQPEVQGWYRINMISSAMPSQPGDEDLPLELGQSSLWSLGDRLQQRDLEDKYAPQMHIRLQLELRDPRKDPSEEETENSRAMQSILISKDDKKTAISAIWNMRDNIKYVQNLMNSVLDSVESFKNIWLWVYPIKTLPLYVCIVAAWLVSIYVPGRYIILTVGLYEFFNHFIPEPEDRPMSTRFMNLMQSIPNDDDLEQVYFWERKTNTETKAEEQRLRLKQAKLRLVFDCQWEGLVRIKGTTGGWEAAYLVVQGHRLVWWSKEEDVDEGRAPVGQLLLQGHAGTTQASPLDIREVGDDSRLVAVFGKDLYGAQQKRTILCRDSPGCKRLAEEVEKALGGRST